MNSRMISLSPAGGCQNSSPAGKRRIAVSAERAEAFQVLGSAEMPPYAGSGGPGGPGASAAPLASLTAITGLAIAACLCVVMAFVIIFLVLQVCTGYF